MAVKLSLVLLILGILLSTSQLTSATGQVVRGIKDRGVGIHLGSTYSSVAVHKVPYARRGSGWPHTSSDFFQLVTNERGSNATPSCVAFTDSGVLIGEPAKDQEATNPERTICGIIRLMAKRFDDPDVQSYIKTLPYKVVDIENKPHVEVKFKTGVTKVFSPEEICAMILGKMKEIAEAYMGVEIELASILVHQSYYSEELWQSIHKAGKIAGIKDVYSRYPSKYSVALAHEQFPVNLRAVIYNLGGTAFHVSIVDDDYGIYEITSAREDMNLGGQTFDSRVVDYFTNLIKNKYKKDISDDLTALVKLRRECERAKIALSSTDRVTIKIDSLSDGILLFEENLTRETFEDLNMDLFNRTVELVKQVMEEAEVEKKTPLYEVIILGGNARIPKIQGMLKELFGRQPVKGVNPDEALAFAGAYISGYINGKNEERPFNPVAAPLSLGIETIGGIMKPFVEGGSLDVSAIHKITTSQDQQTTLKINVFEGERPLTKHCRYLGTIEFSDLPPAPRGVVEIVVEVEVGNQWDTLVTAVHRPSNTTKYIMIPVEQRFSTYEKFKQVREEAKHFCREDSMEKSHVVETIKMCLPLGYYSTESGIVYGNDFDEYFGVYGNMDHSSMDLSGLKELCKNTSMIHTMPPQCDPCKNECYKRFHIVGQEKSESLLFDGKKSSFFSLRQY